MKNTGDGRRVQRVEKEVQSVLGMYLIHGFSQPLGAFVNISKVIMSGDLRNAKVFISILPKWKKEDEESLAIVKAETEELTKPDEITELLNDYAFEFQDKISSELKLRYVPKLKFYADIGTEKVIKVESLLTNISKGPSALINTADSVEDKDKDEDKE